eukprot:426929_1
MGNKQTKSTIANSDISNKDVDSLETYSKLSNMGFDMDKLDLDTFKQNNVNDVECKDENYTHCSSIKRLLAGLKYYSMLNVTTNETTKSFGLNLSMKNIII